MTSNPTPTTQPQQQQQEQHPDITYLTSLTSIRDRCSLLLRHPDALTCFDLETDRIDSHVVPFLLSLIVRDYAPASLGSSAGQASSPLTPPTTKGEWLDMTARIPPHTRCRHVHDARHGVDRMALLVQKLHQTGITEPMAITTCLVDFILVAVLLDAGAGDAWVYRTRKDETGDTTLTYTRSEGLAVATFDLFLRGGFSSSSTTAPYQVDAQGLAALSEETFRTAFQVDDVSNPLVGVEGRLQLLRRLGKAMRAHSDVFGTGAHPRPGNLVSYLLSHPSTTPSTTSTTANSTSSLHFTIPVTTLWYVIMTCISKVWPSSRTQMHGQSLGDVWPCTALSSIHQSLSNSSKAPSATASTTPDAIPLLPFHKLSQWLAYSLMDTMSLHSPVSWSGVEEAMTGLAEYRNGGLLVDMGVLRLKPHLQAQRDEEARVEYEVGSQVVVEWRGLTVALLDLVAEKMRQRMGGLTKEELPLVKVLEAGTWKAGREMAAKLRPDTKGPPIHIISDGTVF